MEDKKNDVKEWANFPWSKAVVVLISAISTMVGITYGIIKSYQSSYEDRIDDFKRKTSTRDSISSSDWRDVRMENKALNRENDSLRTVVTDSKTEGLERLIKVIDGKNTNTIIIKPKK